MFFVMPIETIGLSSYLSHTSYGILSEVPSKAAGVLLQRCSLSLYSPVGASLSLSPAMSSINTKEDNTD